MNILLSDDDAAILESVISFLKQFGHRVSVSADCKEGLKLLESNRR